MRFYWQMDFFNIADILSLAGFAVFFVLAFFASVFYHSIEELSHSEYSEIKNKGTTASTMVVKIFNNEDRSLAALEISLLIFQSFSVLLFFFFMNRMFWHCIVQPWSMVALVLAVLLFLLLVVVLTLWLPKYYTKEKEVRIVSRQAFAINFLVWVFGPVANLSIRMKNHYAKDNSNALSDDEMSDVIEIAEGGKDVESETQMLKGIVRFGDLEVSEIMRSRLDVVAVDINTPIDKVVSVSENTGFSRIPVYEGTIDNIKGILYVKDLIAITAKGEKKDWNRLIRDPFFVPENKSVSDMLHDFKKRKMHLAIVVDEYGGVSGLVTLEDIIEEIVGEISDEYDKTETLFETTPDGAFVFEAKTSINDFCKVLELSDETFDEMRGDAETLAGLILEIVGEIPQTNTDVKIKDFTFNIQKADNRRIEKVKVTIEKDVADEN